MRREEDQVAPLELARRMKELGFPQDCLFAWFKSGSTWVCADVYNERIDGNPAYRIECAAPTVAEIGEALPDGAGSRAWSRQSIGQKVWGAAEYVGDEVDPGIQIEDCSTEVEARARLWIAMSEKKPEASRQPCPPHKSFLDALRGPIEYPRGEAPNWDPARVRMDRSREGWQWGENE